MFKKLFASEKKEGSILQLIRKHIELLNRVSLNLKHLLHGEKQARELIDTTMDLEREADILRREILGMLYQGAFLPYLRPSIYRFVELTDETIDLVEELTRYMEFLKMPKQILEDLRQISILNCGMCEMLILSFDAFVQGFDLQEKILALRIYEKRVDDLYHDFMCRLVEVPVENFWLGKMLWEFINGIARVSDLMEDMADVLSLLELSFK